MIFNNTISIADIISIIAILATFITILQVKHQRADSLKPFLTIKPSDKYFVYKKTDNLTQNKYDLFISNIGSHLAKNASIEISLCNMPLSLLSGVIKISQSSFTIDKTTLYMLHKSLKFTYIEPQDKHNITTTLENYIILLCNIYLDLFKSNKLNNTLLDAGEILIKISYYNIINHNFTNYLSLKVNPCMILTNEINFNIDVKELTKKVFNIKQGIN